MECAIEFIGIKQIVEVGEIDLFGITGYFEIFYKYIMRL